MQHGQGCSDTNTPASTAGSWQFSDSQSDHQQLQWKKILFYAKTQIQGHRSISVKVKSELFDLFVLEKGGCCNCQAFRICCSYFTLFWIDFTHHTVRSLCVQEELENGEPLQFSRHNTRTRYPQVWFIVISTLQCVSWSANALKTFLLFYCQKCPPVHLRCLKLNLLYGVKSTFVAVPVWKGGINCQYDVWGIFLSKEFNGRACGEADGCPLSLTQPFTKWPSYMCSKAQKSRAVAQIAKWSLG